MTGRYRGWCVTINNFTEDDEINAYGCAVVTKYCIFGRETGESGTPHLQGFIYFDNPQRFDSVRVLFNGRAHIENMKGTPRQASDYCKKDGDFFEEGTCPLTQTEKGDKGKPSIQERWSLAKAGDFEELPPEHLKIYKHIYLSTYTPVNRDNLENYWIMGPTGTGKSTWARQQFPKIYWKLLNKWWDDYEHEEDAVIMEDIGPQNCEKSTIIQCLKIWADHYPFRAEFKGGSMMIRPKAIVVTSNYGINDLVPDARDAEPLFRRFKVMQYNGIFGQFVQVN